MIGSSFAALIAGYNPKIIPVAVLIPNDNNKFHIVTIVGMPANFVTRNGINKPKPTPIIPPTIDSTSVSIKNCITI